MNKLRAYAELLRVSNVLTAVADVWMGMIVATGTLAPALVSAPLTLCSVCLYLSGMVLNDVFDAKRDAVERPTRPIPSGRISFKSAAILGSLLMLGGPVAAALPSGGVREINALPTAATIAALILLYNGVFKKTPLGPVCMGLCRGGNVLLGVAAFGIYEPYKGVPKPPLAIAFMVAGMTTYVIGLTWFARKETRKNKRMPLLYTSAISLAGIGYLAAGPLLSDYENPLVPLFNWYVLWAVIALLIGRRYVAAILWPTPRHIQSAVGNAIQGIILIDAALAWGYAGPFWGLAILALLPPTMLMARFIPQT